jgi:5-methylthioadenosine/S-adenosylhomocysteine deaminase
MADGQKEPIDGYILVADDGTITAVHAGDPPANLNLAQTWDGHGAWVIPGFISAHSHLWQAAYRGLAANKTLPGWIADLYGKHALRNSPDDFYWFTLYGCARSPAARHYRRLQLQLRRNLLAKQAQAMPSTKPSSRRI